MQKNIKKNLSIQSLRAISFLLIFLHHAALLNVAGLGVSLFFIMSGFLLSSKYYGKDHENALRNPLIFSVKHIKKLYLLHFLTLLLAVPFTIYSIIFIEKQNIDLNFFLSLLANLTLVQSLIPVKDFYMSFNGVSWFLSTIAIIYILFPIIIKIINRFKMDKWKIILAIISILLIKISVDVVLHFIGPKNQDFALWITYIFPLSRLPEFITGILISVGFSKYSNSKNNQIIYPILILFGIALGIIASLICSKKILNVEISYLESTSIWIIPSLLIFIGFVKNKYLKNITTENILLVKLGDITPYAFLIHQVVLRYLNSIFDYLNIFNIYIVALCAFVISIVASIVYKLLHSKIENIKTLKKT